MSDVVFDTGALIALESNSRALTALLDRAQTDTTIHIPSAVLAQAWRDGLRGQSSLAIRAIYSPSPQRSAVHTADVSRLVLMQFSLACQPTQVDDLTWVVDATTEWRQGRTTYGGLVAAWLANAMAPLAPEEQQMRTLSVTFAGPIAPGAAEIKTEVDRRGKSTTFTSATITSEEGIATRASAVFTRPRATSIGVEPRVPKLAKSMAQAEPLPELEGLIPKFMQHFELRFGIGSLPFVGADEPLVGGYCRHREAALGVGALAGLIDAWPPAILAMANGVIPSSSVTWNIHFLDPDVHVGTDWFEFRYEALAAKDGYSTCAGTLSKDGRPVAMTEQMTAYFG